MNATKLTVPLLVVLSLLAGVLGAGRVFGADKEKLEATAARVDKLEEKREKDGTDIAGLKSDVKNIAAGVDRLERAMGTKR